VKPRLLDLFCGAGGAAMGYHSAGFEVVGVDIKPQPRYPFEFHQADALALMRGWALSLRPCFQAIHASPPCQRYSRQTAQHRSRATDHPDLVEPTRKLLEATGLPWVIENVEGAPLENSVTLCGSMFGLGVRRHRLFEANFPITQPECDHPGQGPIVTVTGNPGGSSKRDGSRRFGNTASWRMAMVIDWMTGKELAQAIPPAYTEHIGRQLYALVTA
jgi:DNA (cytosine-5)-methyltransferase 1